MGSKIAILSDIHGNLSALNSTIGFLKQNHINRLILLGDLIDYGMRSNQVIKAIQCLGSFQIHCNIWGNHEDLILNGRYHRLSTDRGRRIAAYTSKQLDESSISYLKALNFNGKQEFELNGKKCLAVHGSLDDCFWKSISPEELHGDYSAYDMVFSGHSHVPHYFYYFYPTETREMRKKKATVFINPGSVGQPRNHWPLSQFAILDESNMSVYFQCQTYDVAYEQSLYPACIDAFYKERLKRGV